jgi:hypothetical protein
MWRFLNMIANSDHALILVLKDVGRPVHRTLAIWNGASARHSSKCPRGRRGCNGGIATLWLRLALCEREHDASIRALAVMTDDGCREDGLPLSRP